MTKKISKNLIVCSFSFLFLTLSSGAFCFELSAYDKKVKNFYSLKSIIEKISRDQFEKSIHDFLSNSRPGRSAGSIGHDLAQKYLEEKLKSFKSERSTFRKQNFKKGNYNGANLIWEKKGLIDSEHYIILGAHYDTSLIDSKTKKIILKGQMPGADKNASGVVALLNLIEILDKLDLSKSVQVVFFDLEELEHSGSIEFTKEIEVSKNKIQGFIDVLMIANDSKLNDKDKKLSNMSVYVGESLLKKGSPLKTILERGMSMYPSIDFKEISIPNHLSAAQSFRNMNIESMTYSGNQETDPNPRINTPNDFLETLNFTTYFNSFRSIAAGVLAFNFDMVK